MARFYVPSDSIANDRAVLSQNDSKHALRVLRLRTGDVISVCDGKNNEYDGIIQENNGIVEVALTNPRPMLSEPNVEITLFQGVPKAGKLEYTIQKGVEAGICAFVPFYSARCVVKDREKTDRYSRIAEEAAKQSGRGRIPSVAAPVSFSEMLRRFADFDLVIAAWECERERTLKSALKAAPNARSIAVVVGPEGGIEPAEAQSLSAAGATLVTLGERILRTETAGVITAACIIYEYQP